jgi:hypothetical protein
LKIYDFTVPELNYFRDYCNFTEEERILFEYRAKNIPLETCAEIMNVSLSTAKRISKRINNKIIKVC